MADEKKRLSWVGKLQPMAEPQPLAELPENLERFFRGGKSSACCG